MTLQLNLRATEERHIARYEEYRRKFSWKLEGKYVNRRIILKFL
jgi:hypothetical protein